MFDGLLQWIAANVHHKREFASTSGGVKDANRPVKLDAAGVLSTTFLPAVLASAGVDNIMRIRPSAANAVANDGTLTLNAAFVGFLFIMCTSDASVAIFDCTTSNTHEIADPNALYSITKNNAGTTNIYVESGNVILQNKRGAARGYAIVLLGASTSF